MANVFILYHSQRTEIKKAADESQSILEETPVGKGNDDGSLRAFLKVQIAFTMRGIYVAEFDIFHTCSCYSVRPGS